MKHSIIYKDKDYYCSFPIFKEIGKEYIEIGFFKAPCVDHCGLYEWIEMKSENNGLTWKRKKIINKNNFPRLYSDRYIDKDCVFGAVSWKSVKYNKENYKKLIDNNYVVYKRKNDMIVGDNMVFWVKNDERYEQKIYGVELFLLFPRHLKIGIPFLSGYGCVDKKYKPFLIKLSNNDCSNYKVIDMFHGTVNASETAFVQIDDNILYCLTRGTVNQNLLESWSFDNGETWSYPKLLISGHPAHLLKLKDGRILCTLGHRTDAMGIKAIVSKEIKKGQIIWDRDIKFLRDDGGYPSKLYPKKIRKKATGWADVGYPVSVQLGDGSILTIYYITLEDGITHIAQTRWEC